VHQAILELNKKPNWKSRVLWTWCSCTSVVKL
jgi:hypothetical protein